VLRAEVQLGDEAIQDFRELIVIVDTNIVVSSFCPPIGASRSQVAWGRSVHKTPNAARPAS